MLFPILRHRWPMQAAQVPERFDYEDLTSALQLVLSVVNGFPLSTHADRSAFLSALLTTVCKSTLEPERSPIFAIRGPKGCGKSLLVDSLSEITTHQRARISAWKDDERQAEFIRNPSRYSSFERVICFDNVESFGSRFSERAFAESPLLVTWCVTGDHRMQIDPVIRDRVVTIWMVDGIPCLPFPVTWYGDQRNAVILAICCLAQAWDRDGNPTVHLNYNGPPGLTHWHSTIRQFVIWLGSLFPTGIKVGQRMIRIIDPLYMERL